MNDIREITDKIRIELDNINKQPFSCTPEVNKIIHKSFYNIHELLGDIEDYQGNLMADLFDRKFIDIERAIEQNKKDKGQQ